MPALRKKASAPMAEYSGPATAMPAPMPRMVAASKRAEVLPRSTWSCAVATAMKPRIDGTLAAVEAPSSRRVDPSTQRLVVRPVRMAATSPKSGPNCITR